jgi:hypothetical protein
MLVPENNISSPADQVENDDPAARDSSNPLSTMPLSMGRYLRKLGPRECRELGRWLLRRARRLQIDQ